VGTGKRKRKNEKKGKKKNFDQLHGSALVAPFVKRSPKLGGGGSLGEGGKRPGCKSNLIDDHNSQGF